MLLLSLVGEQPIPNLLPLWQFKDYTAVQFAATSTTWQVALNLERAICQDPQLQRLQVLSPLQIPAYEIGAARQALAAALLEHQRRGEQVHLNLTGGTKLMSLAALQAAYGTGAALLYVSTEENQIIRLASDASELSRHPIQVNISVQQYLSAHGLEVSEHPSFEPGRPAPDTPPTEGSLLEEQVYRQLLASGEFDDVRRRVYIRKHLNKRAIQNELDICVTRNGRMLVGSCKTGNKVNKEAIYELSSISRREAAGIYCVKVLITDNSSLTVAVRDRARAMGVHLVYGPELDNLASRLHNILKS